MKIKKKIKRRRNIRKENFKGIVVDNKNNQTQDPIPKQPEVKQIQQTKKYLIITNLNLSITDGSTIWLSNLTNSLIKEKIEVTILSAYTNNNNFLRNIENTTLLKIADYNLNYIDQNHKLFNTIIIRDIGFEILDKIKDKNWLNKTILYGLNPQLKSIKNLNNKYYKIWTQSEKLKTLYIESDIKEEKIQKILQTLFLKKRFGFVCCDIVFKYI